MAMFYAKTHKQVMVKGNLKKEARTLFVRIILYISPGFLKVVIGFMHVFIRVYKRLRKTACLIVSPEFFFEPSSTSIDVNNRKHVILASSNSLYKKKKKTQHAFDHHLLTTYKSVICLIRSSNFEHHIKKTYTYLYNHINTIQHVKTHKNI